MKTKYEIVCELTEAGKSAKEIIVETGFTSKLVYAYKTKINSKAKSLIKSPAKDNKNRALCPSCIYRGRDRIHENGCDYAYLMDHSRGCTVEECNRYVKGPRIARRKDIAYSEARHGWET